MTEASKAENGKSAALNPHRMLLARERNLGFTARRVFVDDDARAGRLASAMADRAGLTSENAALERLLQSALGNAAGAGAEAGDFVMDEFESTCDGAPAGFAGLVRPLSPGDFFGQQHKRRRPMLFRGPADRFSSLMGWDDLNRIIRARNLKPPQLKVSADGQSFPATDLLSRSYGLGWQTVRTAWAKGSTGTA